AFVKPQLCETAALPPASDGWAFELKYDGYRLLIAVGAEGARIYTRSGLDWTARFPALARAAAALPCANALIDGEAVVLDARGLSDFAALVAALEAGDTAPIDFLAFDLLVLDEADLREQPLRARKALLKKLLARADGAIRYADFIEGDGAAVFAEATRAGAEGVIAKRADAPYRGGRSSDWLKVKSDFREDVAIIGYMPSLKGESFASLLAAKETPEGFRYVGRVGTGYDVKTRRVLAPLLAKRGAKNAPPEIGAAERLPKGAVYLATPFAAEVRFGGWTSDAQMRQARFLGHREDAPPPKTLGRAAAPAPRPSHGAAEPKSPARAPTRLAPITNGDRVVFPADGVTKGDVAAYYDAVAARMAPHLDGRIVSLLRAPENIEAELFFQRHPLKGMAKGVIPVEIDGKSYFSLEGAVGLHTAAQFGAIELHGWMARRDEPERPDRMVFDLDPAEDLPFDAVRQAALDLRDNLSDIGLRAWPLLTGGKGVHLVLPLDRSLGWDDTETFAAGFARGLARQTPERFVATMSKRLRQGRIFIDWLRNKKSATAILPWSLRARPGAPAATPVSWKRFSKLDRANAFDIRSALRVADEWEDFFQTRQTIPSGALAYMRKAKA
ncbi:DNA ligase D, partial [Methylocystis sp. 9N]